ncbi:putative disease resistance protein RGA3, partial [Triticum aestivum]|uniref:putative disease resistance protein RGA3 n=1 Tax=Triticum aestivum TaxID=4565 RepID=UPI001D0355EF
MPKLIGKLLPCSSSQDPHIREKDCGSVQEMAKFEFNRVDFSRKMKDIIEKLQLVRKNVNGLLQSCDPRSVSDIAQCRPITKGRIDEPKLYGRDRVMDSIIQNITKGQYGDKGITVLPVVGSGGMGKTTLIQHVYRSQQVQEHFPVMIWICVSLHFNLDKVLEQIKTCTPAVEKEKSGSTTEDLIEQRLKSKRFLLVLDDIWKINNGNDWGKLLSTLNKSKEKRSMILVTTRFQAISKKVETPGHSIKLNGLECKEFRKLFLAFVFGDEQYPRDKQFLLETGDKIMEKLKGSPLAAKTVGRLLSKDLSLRHWKRVLKSKGWEKQNDDNAIMPALKLSYDFLPFHLQQCFAYSGLFPEDYNFRSDELISLWIGLDILKPNGQDQIFEDIGLSNLNELVIHGFFREEKTYYGMRYVMHDLLHDLALKVASHDCLSLSLPSVGSVEIQPTTRHLSISTYGLGKYDEVSELGNCGEDLKCQVLWSLITTGGQLKELEVRGSHRFFADWDPNPRRALEDAEGGEEQQTQIVSSTLHELGTDDIAGFLAAPVCRFLSSSLTKLKLRGNWCEGMERFSKEQEDALQLLSSLQELDFSCFKDLHQLPAGMSNLTSLKKLTIYECPALSSLPKDGLPKSLQELNVGLCSNQQIRQ